MLKTLTKILLTNNQIQLLSLNNSHVVSIDNPKISKNKVGKSKLFRVETIKSKVESNDNDEAEDNNVVNGMPNYLNTDNHYKFRQKIDSIVQHMF